MASAHLQEQRIGHRTSPAALVATEDADTGHSTALWQYAVCLECLTGIDGWLASTVRTTSRQAVDA